MKIFSPVLKGTTTVSDGTTNLSGSFTGSLQGTAATASYVVSSVTDATQNTRLQTLESVTGSYASTSSLSTSNSRISILENVTGSYASTGSNQFNGSQTVTGSLTATGTITAQTLVVQTITSSVDFVTGSAKFGSTTGNTHQFTGSLLVSGSQTINGSITVGDLISTSYGTARIQVTSTTNSANAGLRFSAKDSTSTTKNAGLYYVAGTTTANTFLSLVADDNNYQFNVLANGNVGIGTTSPVTKLDVVESTSNTYGIISARGNNRGGALELYNGSAITAAIYSLTTNDLLFYNGTYVERMRINSSGSVGIGTDSPGKRVEISEDNSSTTATTGLKITNWSATTDARAGIVFQNYDNNNAAIWSRRTGSTAGSLILGTNSGTGTTAESAIVERMRIDNAGNIGINESSPSSMLHFSRQTTWGTSDNRIININNSGTGGDINTAHNMGSITWYSGNSTPTAEIAAYRNTPASGNNIELRFYTAAAGTPSERMRITSGGDIEVWGGAVRTNGGYLRLASSGGSTTGGYFLRKASWIGTGTDHSPSIAAEGGYGINFYTNGSTTERMMITSGGNVGIGTTSPAYKFQVQTSSGINSEFRDTAGNALAININSGVANFLATYEVTATNMDLSFTPTTSGGTQTEAMRIKAGGNVGIGTNNPSDLLHVYTNATTGAIRLGGGNGSGNARMYFQAHASTAYIDMYGNNSYLPLQINANPVAFMGGNVGIGTTSPAGMLSIGTSDARKISFASSDNVRSTTLFKSYSMNGNESTWCRIRLENNYAQNYQGVWGTITVAYHPYHASMARFYQYRFFQGPYGTNNSYMKIVTVYEEEVGWNYYSFTSDVQFYNFENYLYIKVIGQYSGVNQIRSVTAELTGANVAMDTVQLEVDVTAPARLGLITKNGAASLSA